MNEVRTARRELGLTQDEFSKLLGVSRNYVAMLESGKKPITDAILERIQATRELPDIVVRGRAESVIAHVNRVAEHSIPYGQTNVPAQALHLANALKDSLAHNDLETARDTIRILARILNGKEKTQET